jgi:hypothetical protein
MSSSSPLEIELHDAKLNISAKATVNTICTNATTHNLSRWKPKYSVTNSAAVWSLPSILVWISPYWEQPIHMSMRLGKSNRTISTKQEFSDEIRVECASYNKKRHV